ncbi:HNH endonuclease [Kitasatospora cineracea]
MLSDTRGTGAADDGDPSASDRRAEHRDFLAFVGNYRETWAPDGETLLFERDEERRYSVTVGLYDGRFPRVTFHLGRLNRSAARKLFGRLEQVHNALNEKTGAELRLDFPEAVTFLSKRPVLWPTGATPARVYAPTWGAARRWVGATVDVLTAYLHAVVDAERAPVPPAVRAAPVKKAVAVKAVGKAGKKAVAPRPPVRVALRAAAPALPAVPSAAPPRRPGPEQDGGVPGAGARPVPPPREPARERPQPVCPVCEAPVRNGLIRHRQCEGRRRPADGEAAVPPSPAVGDAAAYRDLVGKVEAREAAVRGQRRAAVRNAPVRLPEARAAVLLRSRGRCENPSCTGEVDDVTDSGDAILEVDHVEEIAGGGRDHPVQMIALCPNCHAKKSRGSRRAELRALLLATAREAHRRWQDGGAAGRDD